LVFDLSAYSRLIDVSADACFIRRTVSGQLEQYAGKRVKRKVPPRDPGRNGRDFLKGKKKRKEMGKIPTTFHSWTRMIFGEPSARK